MRRHGLSRLTFAAVSLTAVASCALLLSACSVIEREMGGSSTDGIEEAVEYAVPGSEVVLTGSLDGFSSKLGVFVQVDDASTVTSADVAAAAAALCSVDPKGYDYLSLEFLSGSADTKDRHSANTGALLSQAYPELEPLRTDGAAYLKLDELCAAVDE